MQQPVTKLLAELQLLGDPFREIVSLPFFLSRTLGIILIVGGIVIFICLLWGGFQWLTAGDDQSKIQNARERLTQCLVGFAILAVSFAIAILAQYFIGIEIFQAFDSSGSPAPVPPSDGAPPLPPVVPPPAGSACDITSTDTNQCGQCLVCTATSPTTGVCQAAEDNTSCTLDCWTAEQCLGGSCQPTAGATNNCLGQPCDPNDPLACDDNGVVCYDPDGDGSGTCTPAGDVPAPTPTSPPTPTPPSCDQICLDNGEGVAWCTASTCFTGYENPSASSCSPYKCCCADVNFGCLDDTGDTTVTIFNSASNQSCTQICNSLGRNCINASHDGCLGQSTYYTFSGVCSKPTNAEGSFCDTPMTNQGGVICNNSPANWTYCKCQ